MKANHTLLLAAFTLATACETDTMETPTNEQPIDTQQTTPTATDRPDVDPSATTSDETKAAMLVTDASETLRQMAEEPQLKGLLQASKGVFIVPRYGRGAAGVGARGGEGVLIAHQDGKWSAPAFYDVGGLSVGIQIGVEGGEIAMLLMSDEALQSFKGDGTFSLNAEAKLTMVDYSKLGADSLGKAGDVVFWSDTEGAFVGVDLAATDISWDDEENVAFYGSGATADGVLSGTLRAPTDALQKQLSDL